MTLSREPHAPADLQASEGGPLAGLRVLDLSAYVAGPFGCTLLADLGADVVKIEPPTGDNLRNYPSTLAGACRFFVGVNRGKRSLVIDLKNPEGLDTLRSLVARADVLVHNFRPGVAERLGIGYEELSAGHPRLIYAGLSGYGESSGPLQARAGFDQVLQNMTGFCVAQAEPGATPEVVYGSVIDYYAASMLALGLTSALYARERTGRGQRIAVSLLGAALCAQSGRFVWAEGEAADVDRGTRSTGVNAIFPTREGHLYISATTPHFWRALCRHIGRADMADDPAYDTPQKRVARQDEITRCIVAGLAAHTAEEWEARLAGEVPCSVSRPIEEMFEHPQVQAEGHLATYRHPEIGSYRSFRTPIQFQGTPLVQPRPAPTLGQHGEEVLREAGLTPARIAALRDAGAVG
ncbi:CoA transferase [Xylophilus sp. GOD-11R]|uniref:CaiB/BaiF CoA transferase family protein n=1 Tax=Xylophilus sp. GOD-11R TaxID=3089814 RepID=UPI00298CB229|nr:CoA transferase [Xylophilus sp. GOD-11R]WPB58334.1 CoA transferase [Xylophilus sp. GOD-11R]